MTARPVSPAEPPAASVLTLIQAIERRGPGAPAAIAFRAALRRKGQEAREVGGVKALDELQRQVAMADPERAATRAAILATAWSNLNGLSE